MMQRQFHRNRDRGLKTPLNVLALSLGTILAVLLLSLILWAVPPVWNWATPTALHLPVIAFWQALGTVVLAGLLSTVRSLAGRF